jgi:protein gp37
MADRTHIEWTDASWNPVRGCTRVSPGCGGANHGGGCYAEKIAARFSGPGQPFEGFAKRTPNGGRWTGKLALVEKAVDLPLRWRKPRRIFVNSMSDLFHENLPDEAIDRVFAVMALAPQHTFQCLTKRAERMRNYFAERWQGTPAQTIVFSDRDRIDIPAGSETGRRSQIEEALADFLDDYQDGRLVDTDNDALWDEKGSLKARHFNWPLPNVWLGVSVEDQARADERIPLLLDTPAAVRFISAEPLLGPVRLHETVNDDWLASGKSGERRGLDWVIAGGESGASARPMHPRWARDLRDQCSDAGVPFFFKQWGEFRLTPADNGDETWPAQWFKTALPGKGDIARMERVGKKAAGRLLDGREHNEFPG